MRHGAPDFLRSWQHACNRCSIIRRVEMNLALLAELQNRLVHAKEFSKVWEYFLDHFGENAKFIRLGERTRSALIESLIIQTAKQVHAIDVDEKEILLTRLPGDHF